MKLAHSGAYSLAATATKLLASLLVIKLVSLYAGPDGVGKFGQFLSLVALVTIYSGGGISSGVIRFVAQYHRSEKRRTYFLQCATGYTLFSTVLIGVLLAIGSRQLSLVLFSTEKYSGLILTLAVLQSLIALNAYIVAILNGLMDMRRVAIVIMLGAVLSISVTSALGYFYQLDGLLYSVVFGQAAVLFISYAVFARSHGHGETYFLPRISKLWFRRLWNYSTMALVSAFLAPVTQIALRDHLATQLSWTEVGYWQAVSKVSEAYLLTFTQLLAVYYLPKLSRASSKSELVSEILGAFRIIVPVVVVFAMTVYLFRDYIISIVFSAEFGEAASLFLPQLLGDVVKIAAFMFSYLMLAKAMVKTFIFSEMLFSATYLCLVVVFTGRFGLIGTMYAHVVNYALYFVFSAFVARRYVRGLEKLPC